MAITEDKLINLGRLKHYHEKLKTVVPFLDSASKIPSKYLPSYVDDVLEFTNLASFPTTGETGKIYVDTSTNKTYRWGGTTYVEISASLALGETPGTAYEGSKGFLLEQGLGTLEQTVSGVQSKVSDIGNTITSIKDYEFLYVKNTTKPVFNTATTSGSINFPTVEFNGPSVDSVQVTIPTFTNSTAGLVEAPQHKDGTDLDILTNKGWSTLAFEFDSSNRNFKLYAGDSSNPIDSMHFNISSASEFGFIKTGYTTAGKNYAVKVDSSGNAYVNVPWTDTNTTYNAATPSANGLMSAADKTKLDGIAAGANAYSHPTGSAASKAAGLYKISTDAQSHVASVAAVTKADITALGIPAQDTTYSAATTSANGLMSKEDKSKLTGIAAGAEVNQNAFSRVTVGSTNIDADSKTDSLTLVAGTNVTITPDATNDKITIAARDTTYGVVTTSVDGLMSKEDKTRLDLLKEQLIDNGKADTLPADILSDTSIVYEETKVTLEFEQNHCGSSDGYQPVTKERTISAATSTQAGVMSAADKTKLDGIVIATNTEIDAIFAA
jgi:hypothetical protein